MELDEYDTFINIAKTADIGDFDETIVTYNWSWFRIVQPFGTDCNTRCEPSIILSKSRSKINYM